MAKKDSDYGSKMIKVSIRFWTNNINERDKKVAWEAGVVSLNANKSKGIPAQPLVRFENLEELPDAIKKALKQGDIKLKPNPKNYVKL